MKKVIGVTGGVGAGKSRVVDHLKDAFGADVISADKVAAELEEEGGAAYQPLIDAFGKDILDDDGKLNRDAFSARIFSDPEALETVNSIVHPLTIEEIGRRVKASDAPVTVIEAAIFPDALKSLCDAVWLIDADEDVRISRLMSDRGYSRAKCEDIIKNQASRDEFLGFCDNVIDNNGSVEDTQRQVDDLLRQTGPKTERTAL